MNSERAQHIIVGFTQLLIALAAVLQLAGVLPELQHQSQLLLALLASVSGAHHAREGINGYQKGNGQ